MSPAEVYHKSISKRFYIPGAPMAPLFNKSDKIRLLFHYEEGFHILNGVFSEDNCVDGIYLATISRDKDIAYQIQEYESKNASPPGDSILHHELAEEGEYLRSACGNKSDYIKNDDGTYSLRCYKCMIVFDNYDDLLDHMKESYPKMMS